MIEYLIGVGKATQLVCELTNRRQGLDKLLVGFQTKKE
jgi:hypothetical protein